MKKRPAHSLMDKVLLSNAKYKLNAEWGWAPLVACLFVILYTCNMKQVEFIYIEREGKSD